MVNSMDVYTILDSTILLPISILLLPYAILPILSILQTLVRGDEMYWYYPYYAYGYPWFPIYPTPYDLMALMSIMTVFMTVSSANM